MSEHVRVSNNFKASQNMYVRNIYFRNLTKGQKIENESWLF